MEPEPASVRTNDSQLLRGSRVFLVLTSRNPLANLGLIWFTVFSSIVHAVIMAWQALSISGELGHLQGDVPGATCDCRSPRNLDRPRKVTE
jgi:hypothetical protein